MQAHNIILSLRDIAATEGALVTALPGGVHHGVRAPKGVTPPFGLMNVEEIGREYNSSGVSLAEYEVTLDVVVADQKMESAGAIIATFHKYWDRLLALDNLTDGAELVLIHPNTTEIGEDDDQELGQDVVLGLTSWTVKIAEHQPALSED